MLGVGDGVGVGVGCVTGGWGTGVGVGGVDFLANALANTMGGRSVMSVVLELSSKPLLNIDTPQVLPASGTEMSTVTSEVPSPMGSGLMVIVGLEMASFPRKSRASCFASSAVAPGTMTCLAASYEALSTECRIAPMRVNSMIPNTIKKRMVATMANSTATAPVRRSLRKSSSMGVRLANCRIVIEGFRIGFFLWR